MTWCLLIEFQARNRKRNMAKYFFFLFSHACLGQTNVTTNHCGFKLGSGEVGYTVVFRFKADVGKSKTLT